MTHSTSSPRSLSQPFQGPPQVLPEFSIQPSFESLQAQAPALVASWAPDRSLISPGPFAWNDVFRLIDLSYSAGDMKAGPRTDRRTLYAIDIYDKLDLVRRESGKHDIELFRRINDVGVVIKVDKKGKSGFQWYYSALFFWKGWYIIQKR